MGVYYDVKEHIILKNDAARELADNVSEWLAFLGFKMLMGTAGVWELSLMVDGNRFSFSGNEVTPAYQQMLRAIEESSELELAVSFHDLNTEFFLSETVQATLEEFPEFAKDLFYSLYNNADCESGAGILSAYGTKGGTLYSGIINPRKVDLAPAGEWVSADTAVVFNDDVDENTDVAAVKACVEAWRAMGADVDFNEETTELYLNYIILRSAADVEKFMEIFNELSRATGNRCGLLGEFEDTSGDDARILILDLDKDGNTTYHVASVN